MDGQGAEVGDGESGDPHRERACLEPGPAAGRTARLTPVAGEEDPNVQLVTVRLDFLEEALDAGKVTVTRVHQLSLGFRERGVRLGGVETEASRRLDERSEERRVGKECRSRG